jgi:hypothetical protein
MSAYEMSKDSFRRWHKYAVLPAGTPIERFGSAGLSLHGRLCFVTEIDELAFYVWDINTQQQFWKPNHAYVEQYGLPMKDLTFSDVAEIKDGPAKGHYRLFGLITDNDGITEHDKLGLRIKIDHDNTELVLLDKITNDELQRLPYEVFSYDWAYCSFADNEELIAVVEPLYVTIFVPEPEVKK